METSKPKVSSEDVNNVYSCEETPADSAQACHESSEQQENTAQKISVADASIEPCNENKNPNISIELPQVLKYNLGSPGYEPLLYGDEANSLLELPGNGKPASDVASVPEGSEKDSIEGEMHLPGLCQIEEAKVEGQDCGVDSLITEASDLLMFSPPEAFKGLNKQLNPSIELSNIMTVIPQFATNDGQQMHIGNAVASGSEHEIEDHPSESAAATGTSQRQDNLGNLALVTSNPSEKMDNKVGT